MMFEDRRDAGRQLGKELMRFKDDDVVVMALPRGGAVLGKEVARALDAPLGLVLVRKISHPNYAEDIGAVAENEKAIYNEQERDAVDVRWLETAEREARDLMERRRTLYYGRHTSPNVEAKTVILVDDGITTGLRMEAAARAMRGKAKRVVVAVPVVPADSIAKLKDVADDVIVLRDPAAFRGTVGAYYRMFNQVNDEEVKAILQGNKGV